MRYNTKLLDELISRKYATRKIFCKAAGLTESAVSRAFKRGKFTTDQIKASCKALDIPDDKIGLYFFTQTDAKREQE